MKITSLKVNSKHCTRFLLSTVRTIYGLLTARPALMNSPLQSNTVTSAKRMFRVTLTGYNTADK
jgi:hypothetical protein